MNFAMFLEKYFMLSGIGWTLVGLAACQVLGGVGSSIGLHIAGAQAAGILSEKPELFGRLFILMALPGTQGLYAFVLNFLGMFLLGVNKGTHISIGRGMTLFFAFILIGYIQYSSAIYQGKNSAAAINFTAKQPEKSGGALLIPALVETYAILGFIAGFLLLIFIQGSAL
jgi:V/A-type H+/Na+-transporting ATPase subunit K